MKIKGFLVKILVSRETIAQKPQINVSRETKHFWRQKQESHTLGIMCAILAYRGLGCSGMQTLRMFAYANDIFNKPLAFLNLRLRFDTRSSKGGNGMV